MNKEEIYQLIERSEEQVQELNQTISQLQQALRDTVEENNRLLLLNYDLKELTQNLHQQMENPVQEPTPTDNETTHLSGKEHLLEFYHEGIHICHLYYGQQRSSLEQDCLLCLGVINQFEDQ